MRLAYVDWSLKKCETISLKYIDSEKVNAGMLFLRHLELEAEFLDKRFIMW